MTPTEPNLDVLVKQFQSRVIGLESEPAVFQIQQTREINDWTAWCGFCGVYYFMDQNPTPGAREVVTSELPVRAS